jgi:hypothetical protein
MTQQSSPGTITTTENGGTARNPVLDAVLAQTAAANAAVVQTPEPEEEKEQDQKPDDKLFAIALKKAVKAYCKGNKGLLLSRIEAGKHCHECFVIRMENGYKDRKLTGQIIFNALAIEADSRADCQPDLLVKMYQTVQILCGAEQWKALCKLDHHPLTIGKLEDLSTLITRVDTTELYSIFDTKRLDDAKALFTWACGDGLKKVSRNEVADRVKELKDPVKFAATLEKRKEEEAEKAKMKEQGDEVDDEEEEEEAAPPKNLIATQPDKDKRPVDWKDVGDGMAGLLNEGNKQMPQKIGEMRGQFLETIKSLTIKDTAEWVVGFIREGCKRHPGKSHEVFREIAKLIEWSAPTIKGFVAGIGDGKDSEEMLQVLADTIEVEYSIVAGELDEAA